ncbi:hypothetical protein RHSIM_Rhsim03G0131400 [Rhododendron simsii]|uniref:Transposase MuDR plant domain-containing protein n=1 Tax=Rhododendron simsii TaxID=118357 RepID=A0A834HAE9_RHOSS|nr:hypothetical protein RHSIM_Rhsim03G0131400 [Rhododendron simsii]
MSTTPQKKLMCFCYFGGERMVNADGVLGKYSGGVSEATVTEDGISFDEDKSKHLRIRDEDGVAMLFHLNDDEVDIYVQEETINHLPHNITNSEGSLAVCHEMGLVPYSQQRGEDIQTGDGQLFDNPSLFEKAVILFSALNKFTFKYLDNSRSYYRLVCVIDGCPWKLMARSQGKSKLIRVIKLNNEHLHTARNTASFKPRIRAKEKGMIFNDKLLVQPELLPRSICKDFELAFHSPLTYSQGWRTKERARKLISGPISMTYHLFFPVAYAVVSFENYEDWLWFMQNLKETVGDKAIVLVTDRNNSLLRAVKEVFGEEFNEWCARHMKENISKFATGKRLRGNPKSSALDLFTKYARDHRLYGMHMTKLFGESPELAKWVEDNGPQHWSSAFFPHRRWNKLYTNIAESFNNWILKLRDLDIIQFMKGHVNITSDMLFRRKMEVIKWHPLPIGRNIDKKIQEIQLKS